MMRMAFTFWEALKFIKKSGCETLLLQNPLMLWVLCWIWMITTHIENTLDSCTRCNAMPLQAVTALWEWFRNPFAQSRVSTASINSKHYLSCIKQENMRRIGFYGWIQSFARRCRFLWPFFFIFFRLLSLLREAYSIFALDWHRFSFSF